MARKLGLWGLFVIFFLLIPAVFHVVNYSQSIKLEDNKVVYELPYPGLLPDHPLYFLKVTRDKVLDIATRDAVKKAELYILLSDKRMNAAAMLAAEGKNQLAISTASKSEKYMLRVPPLLTQTKKQGGSYNTTLVDRLKLSNAKHKQILNNLLRTMPQGSSGDLNEVLKLNQEAKTAIDKL